MKIRTGFVSNSSSSSFVVLLPENFEFAIENINDDIIEYYIEEFEEQAKEKILQKLNQIIISSNYNKHVNEYNNYNDFKALNDLIPDKYVIASFDTGSDQGEIVIISRNKLKELYNEN